VETESDRAHPRHFGGVVAIAEWDDINDNLVEPTVARRRGW
jgi:hypothetical protein